VCVCVSMYSKSADVPKFVRQRPISKLRRHSMCDMHCSELQ